MILRLRICAWELKSPEWRLWLGCKSVEAQPSWREDGEISTPTGPETRNWRELKSPGCYDGRSKKQSLSGTKRCYPSRGTNKDRRKPEPVGRRLYNNPSGYNKDHKNLCKPNSMDLDGEEHRKPEPEDTVVAVYLHRFSSLFLLFVSLSVKIFNYFFLLLVRDLMI